MSSPEKLTTDSLVLLRDGYRDSRIVRVGDIAEIEVAGNDVVMKMCGNGESITNRGSLKRCMARLPSQFFRMNRNYVVNLSQVSKINSAGKQFLLVMKDGKAITVSRIQSRLLRKKLSI